MTPSSLTLPHDSAESSMETSPAPAAPMTPPGLATIPSQQILIPGTRSLRFEGRDFGSGVSFFLVSNDPGDGPGLHRHPYTETWTVLEGQATITVEDEQVLARAGETAVVQPGLWHRFENSGTGVLRIVCVHASPVMIQEFADDVRGGSQSSSSSATSRADAVRR